MSSNQHSLDIRDLSRRIIEANHRIRPYTMDTPLLEAPWLSENGNSVYLKLESEQHTGSFKVRGSMNKVLLADNSTLLVTASTGNHAQGMARALQIAKREGIIFMPENADQSKIEAVKQFNTPLQFHGNDPLKTEIAARLFAEEQGGIYVSPYNDIDIIAGQGTIGIELLRVLPNLDYVFVTIGGGGLASGIAAYLKHFKNSVQIIGCLPANSPDMYESVKSGRVVMLDHPDPTLSDGSAGGLEEDAITFDLCRRLVDDYCLISETEIAESIRDMIKEHHKIVEGAAAVAIAGYRQMAKHLNNKNVAIIVCGSNISYDKLLKVVLADIAD